ncbi:hypothetical protein J1605_007081 [Eschrichtius robustus]|uniref:Uncharacterized protein n=1 Tax=Eschrichtius robustus TaxID=9764 RepID=A0AB34H1A2_ESCRO|nr:hypothetical protein J1605_007081 [Eschrichtius robustus]
MSMGFWSVFIAREPVMERHHAQRKSGEGPGDPTVICGPSPAQGDWRRPRGRAKRTSLPAAARQVLSRYDGQCGDAGTTPRSRGRSSGDQLQASSLRPPG